MYNINSLIIVEPNLELQNKNIPVEKIKWMYFNKYNY